MSKILQIAPDILSKIALHQISQEKDLTSKDMLWLIQKIQEKVDNLLKLSEEQYARIYQVYLCDTLGVREDQIIIKDDLVGFSYTRNFEVEAFLTLHTPNSEKLYTLEKALSVQTEDLPELKTDHSVYGILTLDQVYELFGERFTIKDGIAVFQSFAIDKIYPECEVRNLNRESA